MFAAIREVGKTSDKSILVEDSGSCANCPEQNSSDYWILWKFIKTKVCQRISINKTTKA